MKCIHHNATAPTHPRSARSAIGLGIACLILLAGGAARADDWPQFRGPQRDGKSAETGLLKQWPDEGPKLLWSVENAGAGYASVVAVGDRIYTTGLDGETGHLCAYDLGGQLLWKKPYGPGWTGSSRTGTRTTPTIDGGQAFVMTGHGRVVCLDADTGQVQWSVDTKEAWGAQSLRWGITESLLVHGDAVICTPGGDGADVVALNRNTGDTIWTCDQIGEKSAYCSPILLRRNEKDLVITLTGKSLVALDWDTGELIWQHPHKASYGIHAVSPVYHGDRLYITSGYGGQRGEMLELSANGQEVTSKWRDKTLDCHHGGVLVHDGHLYGTNDRNRSGPWVCLDLETGTLVGETKGVGKGSAVFADGMLVGYGENGQVGLIKASPDDFGLLSSFEITKGEGEHWSHPAIADGRLYIRHGNTIMAYDIKGGNH